jgi:hypothetical protein
MAALVNLAKRIQGVIEDLVYQDYDRDTHGADAAAEAILALFHEEQRSVPVHWADDGTIHYIKTERRYVTEWEANE